MVLLFLFAWLSLLLSSPLLLLSGLLLQYVSQEWLLSPLPFWISHDFWYDQKYSYEVFKGWMGQGRFFLGREAFVLVFHAYGGNQGDGSLPEGPTLFHKVSHCRAWFRIVTHCWALFHIFHIVSHQISCFYLCMFKSSKEQVQMQYQFHINFLQHREH